MTFTITPVGVNIAFTRTGFQTNYLIRGGAETFLLDCGTSAGRALSHLGVEIEDVDSVYVSHLHLDHAGGLVELALKRFLNHRPRPRLYLHESIVTPLWEEFLRGPLSRMVDREGKECDLALGDYFDLHSLNGAQREIGALRARLISMPHVAGVSTHGLILEDSAFITTDTKFNADLLYDVNRRYPLQQIFHDCSFDERSRHVHATVTQLQKLPEEIRKVLVLTHYEDSIDHSAVPDGCQLGLAGKDYPFTG